MEMFTIYQRPPSSSSSSTPQASLELVFDGRDGVMEWRGKREIVELQGSPGTGEGGPERK